ncbi:MAG: hypothetical protein ACRD8W_08770 [Nitrososphaeraceae archaeon]
MFAIFLGCCCCALLFAGAFPSSFVTIKNAWAQKQLDDSDASGISQFKVTFDAIKVYTDHDPLFSGEWVMDAYVNDQRVPLLISLQIDNGQTVSFSNNNTAAVRIPQNGSLRIITVGYENDRGSESLPDISSQLGKDIKYEIYVFRAQDLVESLTVFGANDPNGFVSRQFTALDDFGVGDHRDCAVQNVQATDPSGLFESACDFELFYHIEEVQSRN